MKRFFKKIFLEEEKSDWLFIIILILFYIVMQLTFPYFLSVVMSTSMQHESFSCEKYLKYNITCEDIASWPYQNGINQGDVVIIIPVNPYKDIKVGDVILYRGLDGKDILHRVIKIVNESNKLYFVVMGDNNPGPIPFQKEDKMEPERIIGKAIIRIPYLGIPKVLLVKFINYTTK